MFDWDDLRLLLAVARSGSFVAAARKLKLDHTTVSRRLTAFEKAAGAGLFHRSPRGVTLTEAGQALLRHAERIEAEVLAATSDVSALGGQVTGSVRLATPEAFGTWLVAPNAHRLHARHPGLELELAPKSRTVSLSKREADIAIGLRAPPRGRLIARRLVDYRLGLYASPDYLAGAPPIRSPADLSDHAFVRYIDDLLDMPELRLLEQIAPSAPTVFRSSSVAAQQNAVSAGLGLGLLHLFAVHDPKLVRVLPDLVEVKRSYWLIVHADQQQETRIRAVIEFLDELVADHRASF